MATTTPKATFWVAFGANMASEYGGPRATLNAAKAALCAKGLSLRAESHHYQTPCFPLNAGPDYVNFVVEFEAVITPKKLLATLHEVEAQFGRERNERWGQRAIDLDIVAVDQLIVPNPEAIMGWVNLTLEEQVNRTPDELLIPHPRLQDRAFVLIPLAELRPNWVHPILDFTVQEMCDALPDGDKSAVTPLPNPPL